MPNLKSIPVDLTWSFAIGVHANVLRNPDASQLAFRGALQQIGQAAKLADRVKPLMESRDSLRDCLIEARDVLIDHQPDWFDTVEEQACFLRRIARFNDALGVAMGGAEKVPVCYCAASPVRPSAF